MNTPISPMAIGIVGPLAGGTQMQDPRGLGQSRGAAVAILTTSGSNSSHFSAMSCGVDRRGLRVVVADDPLGLAEPADLGGDIHLEVDVVNPQRHGLAKELLPLVFVAAPQTAVDAPRRIVNTSGVGRSLRIRFNSGSRRRQSIRNSTRSTPASAACFHSSRSDECRPRPIVTQIMNPPRPARGHARSLRRITTPEDLSHSTRFIDSMTSRPADERGQRCHSLNVDIYFCRRQFPCPCCLLIRAPSVPVNRGSLDHAIYSVLRNVVTYSMKIPDSPENPITPIISPKQYGHFLILRFHFVLLTQITNIGTVGDTAWYLGIDWRIGSVSSNWML